MQEKQFRIVVLVVAGLVALGLMQLRFCQSVRIPDKIPAPPAEEISLTEAIESVESSPSIYDGYLEKDASAFGVQPAPDREAMSVVFRHQVDDSGHRLDPKGDVRSIESLGLRLSIEVRRIEGTPRKMMVLIMENLTDRNLAYKIDTRPNRGTRPCGRKLTLVHNAMVLAAGAKQERSECLYKRKWALDIERIETVELPELSYHYVSKVPPATVGISARLGRGHRPPVGSECAVMLPATIRNARDAGKVTWRDFIDFFARHRCDTYRFPEGYKAFTEDAQSPLPAGVP